MRRSECWLCAWRLSLWVLDVRENKGEWAISKSNYFQRPSTEAGEISERKNRAVGGWKDLLWRPPKCLGLFRPPSDFLNQTSSPDVECYVTPSLVCVSTRLASHLQPWSICCPPWSFHTCLCFVPCVTTVTHTGFSLGPALPPWTLPSHIFSFSTEDTQVMSCFCFEFAIPGFRSPGGPEASLLGHGYEDPWKPSAAGHWESKRQVVCGSELVAPWVTVGVCWMLYNLTEKHTHLKNWVCSSSKCTDHLNPTCTPKIVHPQIPGTDPPL